MTVPDYLNLSIVGDASVANGRGGAQGQAVEAYAALDQTNVDLHRRVADALTAILMQAEAVRRNSINSRMNEAAVTSSCEHIAECAKRVWELLLDQPDAGKTRL